MPRKKQKSDFGYTPNPLLALTFKRRIIKYYLTYIVDLKLIVYIELQYSVIIRCPKLKYENVF